VRILEHLGDQAGADALALVLRGHPDVL
jgi:hypothetical protein